MYAGQIVEEGPAEALFRRPRHPYTQGLIACIPAADQRQEREAPGADSGAVAAAPQTGPRAASSLRAALTPSRGCATWAQSRWNRQMRRRGRCAAYAGARLRRPASPLEARPARTPVAIGEEVLRVTALQKHYPVGEAGIGALISGEGVRTVKANEALEFSARHRETVAIVGESGCGKSTFAKVLLGLETATGGALHFAGDEISRTPVGSRTAAQVGALQMVFQNPDETLNPSHSIGAQIARVVRKFGIEREGSRIRDRVLELLDTVKLPREFYRRRPRQLSGRAEAAGRHRPGVRRQPEDGRRRRADFGAGRFCRRGGDRTADGHSARARHDAAVHLPRPRRRSLSRRPGGGDVPRPDHGAGNDGADLRAALSSLHRGAAGGRAHGRPQSDASARSFSKARCRARSTRRPAARSSPAARARSAASARSSRRRSEGPRRAT